MLKPGKSPARIVFVVCAMLGVYFAVTAAQGAIRNDRIDDARQAAQRDVAELRDQKAYLEAIVAYVGSDEYVEQEARRQLGFVRPGEVAFVVVSPEPVHVDTASPLWWERLFPR
jgi:cell division protein FtsB